MRVEPSPFDAQHYGLRIGRLVDDPEDDAAVLAATLDGARAAFDVLFLRLAEHHPLLDMLGQNGHRPVDTLVTSEMSPVKPMATSAGPLVIEQLERVTDEDDLARIAEITAQSITTSHLHADARLPIDQTRTLFAHWARNDASGRAQRILLARDGGALVGYIAALVRDDTAIIDLVAVSPACQGRGIGAALIEGFLTWAVRFPRATVGTQADNPALRLYRRCGFQPVQTHFTYHLWLDEDR